MTLSVNLSPTKDINNEFISLLHIFSVGSIESKGHDAKEQQLDQNNIDDFIVQDPEKLPPHWSARYFGWTTRVDFLVSLNLHLLFLLVAAIVFLPHVRLEAIKLKCSPSNEPDEFESIEVAMEVPEPDLDYEPELLDDVQVDAAEVQDFVQLEQTEVSLTDFLVPVYEPMTDGNIALASAATNEPDTEVAENEVPENVQVIQKKVAQAGGQGGTVQFSLVWESKSDVDLHVVNPLGDRIFFKKRIDGLGGALDVDRNAKHTRLTMSPVENVRWQGNNPASGRYTVMVHLFLPRDEDSVEFELLGKTGDDIDIQTDTVTRVKNLLVFRYFYFGDEVPASVRADRLEELKELQAKEEKEAGRLLGRVGRGRQAQRQLREIVARYPHTDAAVEALKRIDSSTKD